MQILVKSYLIFDTLVHSCMEFCFYNLDSQGLRELNSTEGEQLKPEPGVMCKWGPSGVRVVGETDHKAGTRSPRLVVLCEKLMTKRKWSYPTWIQIKNGKIAFDLFAAQLFGKNMIIHQNAKGKYNRNVNSGYFLVERLQII